MKTCFKCQRELPLSEFYKHPQMGDGHLGKCKACTRKDVADRVSAKSATDLQWVLDERERHRLKAVRQREDGRAVVEVGARYLATLKFRAAHPEKYLAHQIVGNAIRAGELHRQPCEKCGKKAQAHHDDYSKPLEVRWLCPKHHAEHHREERERQIIKQFNAK